MRDLQLRLWECDSLASWADLPDVLVGLLTGTLPLFHEVESPA